jgi:uncharacterized protein YndB with AHSA1/START domain
MSASEASASTVIAVPPDRVWAAVSDVSRMGEWSPEATAARWRGGADGPRVGARFWGVNRSGWRRWGTSNQVVAAEPGRSFAFETSFAGIPISTWTWRFEATGDGGTRVTESWRDRRTGPIGRVVDVGGTALLGSPHDADANRANIEATLARLKEVLESERQPR